MILMQLIHDKSRSLPVTAGELVALSNRSEILKESIYLEVLFL